MPQCCSCSTRGRCQNCSCVKNGSPCSNCHPNRLERCENQKENLESSCTHSVSPGVRDDPPSETAEVSSDDYTLPPFAPLSSPNFRWSDSVDGQTFSSLVNVAYKEIVRWRLNIFSVPSGNAGKSFVAELSRLFRAYGETNPMESIALTAAMVLPALLLQRPHPKAKTKDNISCLEKRLVLWKEGNIPELLREGKIIQQRLPARRHSPKKKSLAKKFSKLMKVGKVKAAMRILASSDTSILSIHDNLQTTNSHSTGMTVLDELKAKHPSKGKINPDVILSEGEGDFHPVVFDCLDADLIRKAALKTNGAAGPSGADANFWKRICTSFEIVSDDLCTSLALVAKKISSTYVDPDGLSSYTACRLIALDKRPGVRPIGIGEVVRRIISKAIINVIRDEIKDVAGTTQLCAGQEAGCETGVHSMREIFSDSTTEAIMFVDASNAFNLLNRQVALLNIHSLCPSLAIALTNTYRNDSSLFVEDETILSSEGTTQGDPLAMPMYALGIVPLIRQLGHLARQLWFADDASAGGSLVNLQAWWEKLNEIGPSFGYYPNASKTWLVVKEEYIEDAQKTFSTHGVNLTTGGHKHLGSAIGDDTFLEHFIQKKVEKWLAQLHTLSEIALTEPHAAYCGFTHGLMSTWNFSLRTTPGTTNLLSSVEDVIRNKFIPALTGRPAITDQERQLLSLPCRLGGLGIPDLGSTASLYYKASQDICGPVVNLILNKQDKLNDNTSDEQRRIKQRLRTERKQNEADKASSLNLPSHLAKAAELAKDKGASNWLTSLPLEKYNFSLSKSEFRDALSMRYGWLPERLPSKCVCSEKFTIDHALSCPRGAFPTIRHNEIRNLTGNLLTEVCNDVQLEPVLQSLTGETLNHATSNTHDEARADISARDFWGNRQKAFFDIKVFNPFAKSNQKFALPSCYTHHEKSKRRMYEQRIIEVEHGSFTPLVFSTTGGMGRLATIFYKRLASMLADKRQQPYATTMGWLRCQLSFSLLRSTILCLRGSRSRHNYIPRLPISTDLAVNETCVAL